MAHPSHRETRHLAACVAAAVGALIAHDAHALVLGEANVRSALGAPLELRIPVTLSPGEWIEPSCFTLVQESSPNAARISGGRVSLQRSASGTQLLIETRSPVNDPFTAVGVVASCKGLGADSRRDYSLSLQALPSQAPSPRPRAETPSIRDIAATLIARIGDTLESLARAIFPDNRSAQRAYIGAMRDANPSLAALRDDEPITAGSPVALPDLRTFARTRAAQEPQVAQAPEGPRSVAEKSQAQRQATPAKPRTVSSKSPAPPSKASALPPALSQAIESPAPRRSRAGEGFVLKLSTSEVDLTPTRTMDERKRAQLRERQLILSADDQVAAVLALRHSVQQLESRVAELQLKLASMPASFPPAKSEPLKIEPPKVEPPKVVAAPPVETEKAQAPGGAVPNIEPPKVEAPKPPPPPIVAASKVEAPPPKVEEPAPKSQPSPAKDAEPAARRVVSEEEWIVYGLWVLAVLLLFAAGYLAWKLWTRRRAEHSPPEPAAVAATADDSIVVADEVKAAEPEPQPARAEYSADGRRIIDADVALPTRLANDSDDLRRRYIEERFPEVTKGAIVLENADSVVKGARLFYEDGAIARAVELLQYAIERDPGEIKCWLALFEIFRLERLNGEFAALAKRFQERHRDSTYWPKVQYFGREIDPGNPLYAEPIVDKFQTIGPAQAKRIAAQSSFDPIAENWLGAPMDFENEVLANELRKAVMAEAGITDGDLLPNPMPALRNVEMFTVA